MQINKIVISVLLVCVVVLLSSCGSHVRKGCGCGADLNRNYNPAKYRHR